MTGTNVPAAVCDVLCQLGLTANYIGFYHTACAVQLVADSPQRLKQAIKYLYADVAAYYNTTPIAVERNIRAAINRIWNENPSRLELLFGAPLDKKPTSSAFLSALAARIQNT